MMLQSHSDTHLPLLPCPSSRCRETLKQVDPRFFFVFFFFFRFSFVPFSFLHIRPSLSVYLSSFLSLPPTRLVIALGQDGSHDRLRDEAPPPRAIRHSSHPTNDSCLCPLTLFTSAFLTEDNVLHVALIHQARLFVNERLNNSSLY